MTDDIKLSPDMGDLEALEPMKDAPLVPAHAVAGLALNMALKYHDINTVQDGALYQQYKLEGKNLHGLHLDMVFHTARLIERFIMDAPNRLSEHILEQVAEGLAAELAEEAEGDDPA